MPIPKQPLDEPHLTARERVYKTLRDWITDGVLKPGEKLYDLEISKYFSVSRTPVREAMQLLADQKLIEIFPGKESRVSEIDFVNAHQTYKIVAELQAMAVEFAFPKITEDIIRELEEINRRFEPDLIRGDVAFFRTWDRKFHEVFFRLADNDFLSDFTETLYSHIMRIENMYYSSGDEYIHSGLEHAKIIEALKQKNLEEAKDAMRLNWTSTIDSVDHV